MSKEPEYEVWWNDHSKVEADEDHDRDVGDTFERHSTLEKAEARARHLLNKQLDSYGSIIVTKYEWEWHACGRFWGWERTLSDHLSNFDGGVDWEEGNFITVENNPK